MKILLLNYEFPPLGGGASPVSYAVADGIAKKGHSVDVVTMGFRGLPRVEKKGNMTIYRVSCMRAKKELCKPHEMLSYVMMGYKKAKELVQKNQYDVCHCHFIIPTGIVARKLYKKFNLPYIITSHGSDVIGYNKRFQKLYPFVAPLWKKIVKDSKTIISPSYFLGEKIKDISAEAHIEIIHNGIDPKQFPSYKKKNVILVVARLFPNKGIQNILLALKNLDLAGWEVKIVGEGPFRNELEKLLDEYDLRKQVKLLGWIPNTSKRMKTLYGTAKIFISASYFENLSMVLLEALASGCDVIASDAGGNKEVISKENLFETENTIQLKKLLIKKMNKSSPVRLEKRFYISNIINQTIKVLK